MAAEHVGNGPRRPDPDPTVLTTQQLDKGLQSLRELIETRLDGGDKAVELLQGTANKMPATIGAAVSRLQELHDERFSSIAIQFAERDKRAEQLSLSVEKRTEQLSTANATAIAAALQAQKEQAGATTEMVIAAMAKMEANFTKLIDQNQNAQAAQTKSMDDKINLLNSRLDKGEGHSKGIGDGWGYVVGGIGMLATLITLGVLVAKFVSTP